MNKLGDLLAAKGVTVRSSGVAPPATSPPTPTSGGLDLATAGKIVLRRERKGRGGKTVTVVTGLPPKTVEVAARELRRALGCGATIDDGAVILQGDLADRAHAWLATRGARKLVVG